MRTTRPSTLAVAGLACAVLTWLLLRVVYNSLPPLPWTGIPALAFVAVAEAWTGRGLRRRILGRAGTKPPDPLFVSRMLVLAKASSMAASLIAGLTLGAMGYLSGQLAAATPRHDMLTAGITLAAALLLVFAALYLEFCCRVPDPS
jgi:Na+/melibiose symporter-like transporter